MRHIEKGRCIKRTKHEREELIDREEEMRGGGEKRKEREWGENKRERKSG